MSEPIFTQVERNVAELEPNAINPRTLKDKAFKELQQSLKKDPHFLKARPIIVSMAEGREGTVIAGNQRLAAAKALGWATVPVVEVRGATEEQEKEWMVKDNLHKGEWDFDKLAEGFDLDFLKDMGFDEKELNKVLANVDNSADDEFDAEKEAEAITEPIVKRGDIWQLGEHRLMCGDSTDVGDVALLMDGKKVDMVFTDPPYGMDLDTDYSKLKGSANSPSAKGYKWDRVIGDDKDFDFKQFDWLDAVKEQFWWGADYYFEQLPKGGSLFVWQKRDRADAEMIGNDFEICWSRQRHKKSTVWKRWVGFDSVEKGEKRVHPTQKPVEVCLFFLKKFSDDGASVLDLFGGSGSTLIACEQANRQCRMMEIDPKYCDVIIKRWEEKTGKKAVKASV